MHHYHQIAIGLVVVGVGLIAASSYWNGTAAYAGILVERVKEIVPHLVEGHTATANTVDDEYDRTLKDFRNFFYVSHWVAVIIFLLALLVVWAFYYMCKRDKMMAAM